MSAPHKLVVMWLDDDRRLFDVVEGQWPKHSGYSLQWTHQKRSLKSGFGPEYEAVLDHPPYVLVFDWDDGAYESLYAGLKPYLPYAILISSSGADLLAEEGVFKRWPEFEGRSLQKPFSAQQLLRLLPKVNGVGPEIAEVSPTLPPGLPVRFLDEHFVPRRTNASWKTSLNRPESIVSDQARKDLKKRPWATHVAHGVDPADPSRFGLLQFTTFQLSEPSEDSCAYVQHVTSLPPELSPEREPAVFTYGATVEGVLGLMRELGFPRGRYYHLSDVPGLKRPLLELLIQEPTEKKLRPLPAAAEMDEGEYAQFDAERQRYLAQATWDSAQMTVRSVEPDAARSNDASVWANYVSTEGVFDRLEVPLFVDKPEHLRTLDAASRPLAQHMVGMLIFDLGKDGGRIDEVADKARVHRPLQAALRYLALTRAAATAKEDQRQATGLMQVQQGLAACNTAPDVENQLIQAGEQLASNGQAHHSPEPTATQQHIRSAIFARFDEWSQKLHITADSDHQLVGAWFGLDQTKFFVVQAAVAALRAVSKGQIPIEPVLVPNLATYFRSYPDKVITETDLCEVCPSPETGMRWALQLKDIATVVALPVTDGSRLLGVLVVRSSRPYEFTSQRVRWLQALVDVARPFLAHQRARSELRDRSALVLHELRSHMTRVRNRIADGRVQPADEASRQALSDAELIVQAGTGLADLYLGLEGFEENEAAQLESSALWQAVDAFGQLCARDHPSLGWRSDWLKQVPSHEEPTRSDLLLRVMNVLVDNAFRHAKVPKGAEVVCSVREGTNGDIEICLVNPGAMRADALRSPGAPIKGHVGLTLALRTCNDVGASLLFDAPTEAGGGLTSPSVRATLRWPLDSTKD